ncbi:rCG57918, partial [Rattus norvegicus]
MEYAQVLSYPGGDLGPRAAEGASGCHWCSLMLGAGFWFRSIACMKPRVGSSLEGCTHGECW